MEDIGSGSTRSRPSIRSATFKNLMDFVDTKEEKIKHMLKGKGRDSKHDEASPSSDVPLHSPS